MLTFIPCLRIGMTFSSSSSSCLNLVSFLLEYIDISHLLASWCISWTPSDSLNSVTNSPSYSFTSLPSFRLGKNYLIWVHVPLSWSSTVQLYIGTRAHRIVAAHLHISYSYLYSYSYSSSSLSFSLPGSLNHVFSTCESLL